MEFKDPIVEQLVNNYKIRSNFGVEKYGTTLHENNRDDFFNHLKEELMDATLYIQKLQSTLTHHNFLSADLSVAICNGIIYKVGDIIEHEAAVGTAQILGFSYSKKYPGEIDVYTTLGYTHVDFIRHAK